MRRVSRCERAYTHSPHTTPIPLTHYAVDLHAVTYSVRTKDWLESKGLPVTYRTFPNLGHAIDDDGIVALSDWLSTVLPSE